MTRTSSSAAARKIINAFLAAGLLDEIEFTSSRSCSAAGSGSSRASDVRLEPGRVVEAPGVAHLKYRVLEGGGSLLREEPLPVDAVRHKRALPWWLSWRASRRHGETGAGSIHTSLDSHCA